MKFSCTPTTGDLLSNPFKFHFLETNSKKSILLFAINFIELNYLLFSSEMFTYIYTQGQQSKSCKKNHFLGLVGSKTGNRTKFEEKKT